MKYVVRTLCLSLAILFILISTSSCTNTLSESSAPKYTIYKEDGIWYFELISDYEIYREWFSAEGHQALSFKNIDEMYTSLVNNNLPNSALCDLHITRHGDKRVKICNPEELYSITAPDCATLEGIDWYRMFYNYQYSVNGGRLLFSMDSSDKYFREKCLFPVSKLKVSKEEAVPELNAIAYWYLPENDPKMIELNISYRLSSPNGTVYILEQFSNYDSTLDPTLSAYENYTNIRPHIVEFYIDGPDFPLQGYYTTTNVANDYSWLADFTAQRYVPAK